MKDDADAYRALLAEARAALGWRIFGEGDDDSHAAATLRALHQRQATLAVAESCTGGLIGDLLTDVPGASRALLVDAVVYANQAKTAFLGVPEDLLQVHGAVSEPVARAMAEGVRTRSGATLAIATTGIAGPEGGTADKPVGTVYVALATAAGTTVHALRFPGIDRRRFKLVVAHTALSLARRWALGID
jgi:nicotinamide-nucleotide amidase